MSGLEAERGSKILRVLLVEDNPGDARLVRLLLTEAKGHVYDVTVVSTLKEAQALSGDKVFDIVLTDLGLPDSRGSATVDAMLMAWPDCPVVVLTGLDDHETGISAVQRGCQDYLVKGFDDPQILERTIRYAIERSVSARELRESEERFRTLVEVSPDAILLCTEHVVVFANPSAIAAFGAVRRQDLQGMPPTRLFGEGAIRQLIAVLSERKLGRGEEPKAERVECLLRRFDGSQFEAEVTVAPVLHLGRPAAEVIVRDITERKQVERQTRLAAAVFETTDEAMMVTDANHLIVAVNPAFERVTGYQSKDVLGRNPHVLASGRHDLGFYQNMWSDLLACGHWHGEVWNRRKDGEVYVQRATFSLIRDADGHVLNHVGVFSDVTDEKEEAERIRYRASFDALTGLPNRSLLHDRLQQALAKASRDGGRLAVLFLDLDGFKPVNDTYGHLLGDQLLVAVAERLTHCVRESDTVARIGGDEFVIVIADMTSPIDAVVVAQKLVETLGSLFEINDHQLLIGTSIGIALYPESGATAEALIGSADQAMYSAKAKGKGRYVVAGDVILA